MNGNYSQEACALLYLGIPENAETWAAIEAQGKDEEAAYWKYASGYRTPLGVWGGAIES